MSEKIIEALGGGIDAGGNWVVGGIGSVLSSFLYAVFYRIGTALCWIVGILDQFFSVMSGMTKVRYEGTTQTLMDVFFGNTIVQNVYWAMALIGILLCFVFAIIAVAKKAVDSGDKMRQSMGGILTGLFKGIIIIVSLTFLLNAVLSISDKLLTQINYAFNHADSLGQEDSIEFKDDQYAAMARVLDTIANYSLNPSYNSRYNLNSCYNEIRADLQYLVQQGVFDFYYTTEDSGSSWQSALQQIVNAADLSTDLSFDVYNASVSNALLDCMELMQTDYSFSPLRTYTRQYTGGGTSVPLDRLVFLMCTMRAAKNPVYNQNVSMEDPLRGAYYVGEKDIYSYEQVSADFSMGSLDYIVMYIVAFKLIWDLAVIMLDCVARIFNMIFLYLIAPPVIGVMPLDDGGKFKQWTTAFVVQCFGVFGTVIAMRVLLIFIPIIVDSDLVLFENDVLNWIGKMILILGGMSTARRASSVITGILADNAGFQAINASNLGDSVRGTMDHLRNRVTGFGSVGEMARNGHGMRSMFDRSGSGGGGGGGSQSGGGGGAGAMSFWGRRADRGSKDQGGQDKSLLFGGGSKGAAGGAGKESAGTNAAGGTGTENDIPPKPTFAEGSGTGPDGGTGPENNIPPKPTFTESGVGPESEIPEKPTFVESGAGTDSNPLIPDVPPIPVWNGASKMQVPSAPDAPPTPKWDNATQQQRMQEPPVSPTTSQSVKVKAGADPLSRMAAGEENVPQKIVNKNKK